MNQYSLEEFGYLGFVLVIINNKKKKSIYLFLKSDPHETNRKLCLSSFHIVPATMFHGITTSFSVLY